MDDYGYSLAESIARGLAQSAAGETVDLGDFSQYLTPELTPAQVNTIDFYKAYVVQASWFVGTHDAKGSVEVLALGEGFIWSILIDHKGNAHTTEATVGEFSTGIEV